MCAMAKPLKKKKKKLSQDKNTVDANIDPSMAAMLRHIPEALK